VETAAASGGLYDKAVGAERIDELVHRVVVSGVHVQQNSRAFDGSAQPSEGHLSAGITSTVIDGVLDGNVIVPET
jgi:hypothetical protein